MQKLHNIGGQKDPAESDASRLSDAELIAQLADQAKALGVDINLSYDYHLKPATEPTAAAGTPIVETDKLNYSFCPTKED